MTTTHVIVHEIHNDDPRITSFFANVFQSAPPCEQRLADSLKWGISDRDGKLIGAATVLPDSPVNGQWYLWLLGVQIDYQGKHIGRRLLEKIEAIARERKISQLHVKTYAKYAKMRNLLKANGWWFVEAEPDDRNNGVAEIWIKPLNDAPIPTVLVGANPEGRGGEWAAALERMPRLFRLDAIVDQSLAVRSYWNERGIQSAEKVEELDASRLRAVVMALPPRAYAGVREACLERRWSILHEKPIGADLQELVAWQNSLQDNPVAFVAGVQRRNHPSYVALHGYLRDEHVRCVTMTLNISRPMHEIPAGHRSNLKLSGGGCLLDLGYHAIDLVQFLLGNPLELVAISLSHDGQPIRRGERETRASLLGRCGASWVRLIVSTEASAKCEKIEVETKRFRWYVDRGCVRRNGCEIFNCATSWKDAECGRLALLAAATLAKNAPDVDLWDHLSALSVVERAYGLSPAEGLGLRHE